MMNLEYLKQSDPAVYSCMQDEDVRQKQGLELIASENFVSKAVLEAQGSVLTNKYAEGYPNKRYYGGCEHVDRVELLAIERAKLLFSAQFANVQPHSGSQANQAVSLALLKPFDTILSLSLTCGGHLTHGSPVNQSGKWFNAVHYGVHADNHIINYEEAEELALLHKPKMIIAGYSAYPRKIDFARFRKIADMVGAYLMVDMAHIAGIIAAGMHTNPLEYADVVTTTTHKTLRGPRGGMILSNDPAIAKLINSAVFPGLQGGPLMHVIAAKAVAFGEALQQNFKDYIKQVILNAQALSDQLIARGYNIVTGGTDNHLMIVDLRAQNITGQEAEQYLKEAHLICNKNTIPFDIKSPMITSGLRLGSPACTTRGLKQKHFHDIGNWIADILDIAQDDVKRRAAIAHIAPQVHNICRAFPIPLLHSKTI